MSREKKHKLRWSRNNDETREDAILMKKKPYDKVVKILRKSERVMKLVLFFPEEVMRQDDIKFPEDDTNLWIPF